jgi:hypothetical protein
MGRGLVVSGCGLERRMVHTVAVIAHKTIIPKMNNKIARCHQVKP